MQTTSPAAGPSGNGQWANPNPQSYPQTQQRNTSNPRQYVPQPIDARENSYPEGYGYPQSPYPQTYLYQGANAPFTSSPAASGSRRTSAPKPISTPPAQSSPAARYYPDPSYPASAPPQAVTHQVPTYPQTAHPYGGGYQNYYEQSGTWPQYQRPGQSPSSTPTHPQSSTVQTPQSAQTRTPATSSTYDCPPTGSSYWPQDANRSQAWSAPRPEWAQNYQNPQYAYQAQYPQYYPQQAPPPHMAYPEVPKKEKKVKKEEDYGGLGKRAMDEDVDKKKKKKEEPVIAKSHLKPPRQAQSAWQLFFNDELLKAKAAVVAKSPGGTTPGTKLNVAQIAKDAGHAYAVLSDEQKVYYGEKVQESKDEHAKAMSDWQATLTPEDIRLENLFRAQQRKEGKSRKGNLKDPNAPKKPLSAYFLFLKGIREDAELRYKVWADETETTKQSVLAAERWRNLSDEEKKPFLGQAETDKAEYETLRKTYEDDAAARARGEEVPVRVAEPVVKSEPPKPIIKDLPVKEEFLDGFDGFQDPMGTDLGLGEWDLQELMGAGEEGLTEAPLVGVPTLNEASEPHEYTNLATPVQPTPLSSSVPVTPHDHVRIEEGMHDGTDGLSLPGRVDTDEKPLVDELIPAL